VKLEGNQTMESIESPSARREEVRDFYERMPYPRPLTSLDEHRELYRNPERRRALFHLVWPTERPRPGQEILVAGCGTSQAAKYALREPDARVVGIDISETSLTHTRKLQQQYELNNLTLHRLSISDVGGLGQTFDHIVCTGVLHHLSDPDAGLKSLRAALKPDGAMQIMVYARYGRTAISMMREYSRLLGIRSSDEELTAFAAVLNGLPPDHPLTRLVRMSDDFRHPEAIADAFLHPLDRSYSVPEIYQWLDRCGMSFARWFEQAPYLPQCGALASTPHAARLNELPEREQHSAVELFRGTITRHNFVAYRSDRAKPRQPIRFTGDEWQSYVPIRLPWTVCLEDRVPPGSVAVLLNRAHRLSDLVLAIPEAEYGLFSNIDGKRTLSEIARTSGKDEIPTVEFFRLLWQYDQIAFDASRSLA
jgi:SAM-dependent methyltransferase